MPLVLGTALGNQTPVGVGTQAPRSVDASFTTTVGSTLDSTDPKASLTFEPFLTAHLTDKIDLSFYLELDRPFKAVENFALPKTYFLLTHPFPLLEDLDTSARYYLRANEVHRWADEGHMLQGTLEVQATKAIAPQLSLMGRVAASGYQTRYRQRTDGSEMARLGFMQRVALIYNPAPFNFEFHLIVAQTKHGVWKNGYVTALVAEYAASEKVTCGLSHELVGGVIDESTGFRQSLRLFDSRQSRFSAYVGVSL